MSVNIYNPSPAGSTGSANVPVNSQTRQFKDTFTRANNANIGNTWGDSLAFSGSTGVTVVPQILSNKLRLTCGAATSGVLFYPIPLAWMTQAVMQTQFAEITIAANNTTSWDIAVAVVASQQITVPAGNVGYYGLDINPAAAPGSMFQIMRVVYSGNPGAAHTVTNLGAAFGTWNLGDVIRLSAQNNGSGLWTLRGSQNGTVLSTQTDSNLTQGQPAFSAGLTGVTVSVDISEFAGGVGL